MIDVSHKIGTAAYLAVDRFCTSLREDHVLAEQMSKEIGTVYSDGQTYTFLVLAQTEASRLSARLWAEEVTRFLELCCETGAFEARADAETAHGIVYRVPPTLL